MRSEKPPLSRVKKSSPLMLRFRWNIATISAVVIVTMSSRKERVRTSPMWIERVQHCGSP